MTFPEQQEVDSCDGPVLIQGHEGPILRGAFVDGITYQCMHCRQTVLAVNVSDDQLWNLAMRCRACARLTLEAISQIAGIGLNTLGAIWIGQR